MGQIRGSVRLFGKTIQVLAAGGGGGEQQQNLPDQKLKIETQEKDQESTNSVESSRPSGETEDHASVVPDEQGPPANTKASKPKLEEEVEEGAKGNLQEKALKKPEKILPCPRCKSDDTKFCYFNNYNVNQPRHFCRNCQRYWTAGGSMRNVPVGAGRRKNKSSAATPYRPISMQAAATGTTGAVLSFGSDVALCEPLATLNCRRNGDASDEHSNGSSVTVANSAEEEGGMQKFQGYPIGSPWIYQWNSSPPSDYPMSFYPATATHWGFAANGGWNMPWMPAPLPPPQTNHPSLASPPNLPLGKRLRDGHMLKHSTNRDVEEKCLWFPKTMRIDDPSDAANSSVWLTMGIENSKGDKFGKGGLFKSFEPKEKASSEVWHHNPAALSRSLVFRENT